MATERQSQAARANGARSRGPVTAAGKHNSSMNSLRHGMLAQTVVLEGESLQRFEQLLETITAEIQPRTSIEASLVETMAIARWRQMRVWGIQKAAFDIEMARPENASGSPPARAAVVFRSLVDNSRTLDLQHRYETSYDRQFSRALAALVKLRSVKPNEQEDALLVGPLTRATATWEPAQNDQPEKEICGTNPTTA